MLPNLPAGRWLRLYAIAMLVLGSLAVIFSFWASLSVTLFLGWILLFAGVAKGIKAVQTPSLGASIPRILLAVLYVAGGLFVLRYPLEGDFWLTYGLGLMLMTEGVLLGIFGWQNRRELASSRWFIFDGIGTSLLGLLVVAFWPFDATWVLGTLVGISLISSGWTTLLARVD
mgnify:CR=1 FL=1